MMAQFGAMVLLQLALLTAASAVPGATVLEMYSDHNCTVRRSALHTAAALDALRAARCSLAAAAWRWRWRWRWHWHWH